MCIRDSFWASYRRDVVPVAGARNIGSSHGLGGVDIVAAGRRWHRHPDKKGVGEAVAMSAKGKDGRQPLKPTYLIIGDDTPKIEMALKRLRARIVEESGSDLDAVSYTHLRAHETVLDLVCRLPLETKTTRLRPPTRW